MYPTRLANFSSMPLEPTPFFFHPRGYLHLDSPVNRAIAEQLATDPEAVAEHSFFPFILATVITRKIRKKPGGGVPSHTPITRVLIFSPTTQ
jgi:hypothetical protein